MRQAQYFGRSLYAIAIGCIGIQQLYFSNFVNYICPTWPTSFTGFKLLVYIVSVGFISLSIAILAGRKLRSIFITLGWFFLLMIVTNQIPFLYAILPYKKTHLGVWVHVLKELAFAGGAFVLAGERRTPIATENNSLDMDFAASAGAVCFSITMISFGIAHFLYADATAALVPGWIPWPHFWVYCTGAALIASGLSIVFRLMPLIPSFLLGAMIFIWFWVIHLPSAISHSLESQGNETSAAFSALAFSGIAFMISGLFHNNSSEKKYETFIITIIK